MAVPYTFGSATTSIPLSQLDSNFSTTITLGNTAIQLGNTVTTLNSMTLPNATIASGNISATILTSGTVPSARLPAGTVLQVVSTTSTSNASTANTTGTTYVASGFIVTITPTSASNKILLLCSSALGNSVGGAGMSAQFYRSIGGGGYSSIGAGAQVTGYLNNITYVSYQVNMFGIHYLDSPATTSSISYQLYFQGNNGTPTGTCYLNGRNNDGGQPPQLNITAMEVAG